MAYFPYLSFRARSLSWNSSLTELLQRLCFFPLFPYSPFVSPPFTSNILSARQQRRMANPELRIAHGDEGSWVGESCFLRSPFTLVRGELTLYSTSTDAARVDSAMILKEERLGVGSRAGVAATEVLLMSCKTINMAGHYT